MGRLTITAFVILLAPWGGSTLSAFVFWPIYVLVAFVVLRQTWRNGVVEPTSIRRLAGSEPSAQGDQRDRP